MLGSLIDKKVFDLNFVSNALQHFDYSLADRNSKPSTITLPNMHQSASEAWCLLRCLPLMIGSCISRDDPHWKLLLLLLDCVNIIFAPVITAGLIDYLTVLIQEHHTVFKKLCPDTNLLPKHHFLVHYPDFMRKFGPLS